ncbi:AI-2E family transporter [Nocardioides sp.]|uniref:AI-2E family transporter n=1 Tax=Nocardioides sp. TaxID=35761 RepID=UPI00356555F2
MTTPSESSEVPLTEGKGEEPDSAPEPSTKTGTKTGTTPDLGEPGPPLDHRAPLYVGFVGAAGALLAFWLAMHLNAIAPTLLLIVVSFFLAAGLNPAVEWFEGHGMRRSYAVFAVIMTVLAAIALFVLAIVPVITDQIASITSNAPDWLDELRNNKSVQKFDDEYQVIDKIRDYVTDGDFLGTIFGGALGFGLAVLGALFNGFIVLVLTLYFLASLSTTKSALYQLAPASRRNRVSRLGDWIIRSVGGYVSGAFIVATCAGLSSLVFLFAVGLGKYAVALAFVVALLDVIPMIGATIGAVIVTAIGFAEDPKIGIACVIFYVIYQQVENYVIYPRVMSKSVDIPGAVTVIAALTGAALLGVVGALLAIPTAAAVLMLTREVFVRRQDLR